MKVFEHQIFNVRKIIERNSAKAFKSYNDKNMKRKMCIFLHQYAITFIID